MKDLVFVNLCNSLSKANMKEKPAEEDTLKEDIEGIVMGLEHVEEGERSALSDTIHESVRGNRFLGRYSVVLS